MTKIKPLEFCQETIKQKHSIEKSWMDLAARLKEIRDKKLFVGIWDTFDEFLASPEMEMDKGTASKLISIHEKLIIGLEMNADDLASAGGWSKISEVLPIIETIEDANEWLAKCENLSKVDLRKEVQRVKGKDVDGNDCKHPRTYQITLEICRECGYKETVDTDE